MKGTPNKKTQSLIEKCEAKGIDLFDTFLEIIQNEEAEPGLRFSALKEAAQYVYPKRKALEHSGKLDAGVLEQAEELARLSNEELAKLITEEMKKGK